MSQKPVVHVLFNPSAAGSLKQAFRQIGNTERVISQFDDFSFGPIDDENARLGWIDDELAFDDYDEVVKSDHSFWEEAVAEDIKPVVWISLLSANEYAGFLEFLWRRSRNDFGIVDVTRLTFRGGHGLFVARSLGVVPAEQIIEKRLIDRQIMLSDAEIESYIANWRQLRLENAPFRIVRDSGLASAPITHFDSSIAAFIDTQWKKCAHVIGEVITDEASAPYWQANDLILWSRLRKLIEARVFEYGGNLEEMRFGEVRRPGSQASPTR